MILLTPTQFPDYELIDCGDFEKLERFGKYITIRPEPQAVWSKKLSNQEWDKKAHVRFVPKSSSAGTWQKLKEMPDQWRIQYDINSTSSIIFRLGLTSFKHVGVFPEVKRGKRYHGVILDPPAFGHGPNGENWKLEEMINEMMKCVSELLEPQNSFLVLNTYSLGFSSLIIKNLIEEHFEKRATAAEIGEIYLQATSGVVLPLGVVARIK